MKSQFQALLHDAITAKRTGSLTGTASTHVPQLESAEPTNKGFSLLFRSGELMGSEFAGRSGVAAVLQLFDAPTITKVRWFPMREGAIADSVPMMPAQQLEFLMDGSSAVVPTETDSNATKSSSLGAVKHHAVEVFQRFFGDNAEDRVDHIFSGLGPTVTAAEFAQACIKTVAPLLGETMARSYFQQFL